MRGESAEPRRGGISVTVGETHGAVGETHGPQIIYDGNCKLCNQAVRFLRSGTGGCGSTFLPAASEDSKMLLRQNNIPDNLTDKTVILIENKKIYLKSSAIIKALQNRGGWWKHTGLLRLIPVIFRDAIYDFIDRNR
jgi:predicted DCC family thiol-disulfide oxidoreductase YuxK